MVPVAKSRVNMSARRAVKYWGNQGTRLMGKANTVASFSRKSLRYKTAAPATLQHLQLLKERAWHMVPVAKSRVNMCPRLAVKYWGNQGTRLMGKANTVASFSRKSLRYKTAAPATLQHLQLLIERAWHTVPVAKSR